MIGYSDMEECGDDKANSRQKQKTGDHSRSGLVKLLPLVLYPPANMEATSTSKMLPRIEPVREALTTS